jgi:putative phosphoribosyl transferase
MLFIDRVDAGRRLAHELRHLRDENVVVLGLPRGGVPVAFEIARELHAPLDVIVVRKLGVPFQPELGFGAIGEGGVRIIDHHAVRITGLTEREITAVEASERAELVRRLRRFRGDRPPVPLAGRTVLVVDDGIATGSTARAACMVVRAKGAERVVLAVPVGPAEAVASLRHDADEVVCLHIPELFFSIGGWYAEFSQTRDDEVVALLGKATAAAQRKVTAAPQGPDAAASSVPDPPAFEREIAVPAGDAELPGHLTVPDGAAGVVVFAHGSGSSRRSPRNHFVAAALNQAGLGTLLVDLLTPDEELTRANVFDVRLLAARLTVITHALRRHTAVRDVPVGYFGASTGAAAALWAAADPHLPIAAIVSRGGRPDLAGPQLASVRAPTLLIVGGNDEAVLDLNRQAQQQLTCESQLTIIPGATHLFEEPGALERVAELASDWFTRHFTAAPPGTDAGRQGQDPPLGALRGPEG